MLEVVPEEPVSSGAPRSPLRKHLRRPPPPWLFALLPLPYGVFLGYLQTPLPYFLRQIGYTVDRIGSIEAFVLLPMTLYFLWSPIVDFWLRRRTWIVLLSAVSAVCLFSAVLIMRTHLALATWLLCLGFGINLMTTACGGGLLAITQTTDRKARAAAWMQGGGLAAQALGGALLLFLSKRLPLIATSSVAALLVAAPSFVALLIREPAPELNGRSLLQRCAQMGTEVRETLLSVRSLPGLLLLISPVGSGAAQSLFAAMAREFHVGEGGVLLLNGLLGGVLTMLGAFAAVIVPGHWDRRLAYVTAGLACAVCGIFLAVAPMHPVEYFIGVGLYMLTTGACYAFFLGVVMYTLGEGGVSASSRYTILVCLGNLPIVYMTRIEGWGYGHFGPRAVPALDAAGNVLVAIAVILWLLLRREQHTEAVTA